MVIFDTNFALLLLKPDVFASVDRAKERVSHLVNELHRKQECIVIPAPVLAELLVHSGQLAGVEYVREITKSARFKISPFETRAAIEVSDMVRIALGKKDKKDGSTGNWVKVSFDRQIVAIGRVEMAHTIYTDDDDLGKFAAKVGMAVITLSELELPPSNEPLFENLPEVIEEEIESVSEMESETKA